MNNKQLLTIVRMDFLKNHKETIEESSSGSKIYGDKHQRNCHTRQIKGMDDSIQRSMHGIGFFPISPVPILQAPLEPQGNNF